MSAVFAVDLGEQSSGPLHAPHEQWGDRSHLDNSRQLIWDRAAASERAQAAVDALLTELEAAEHRVRRRRAADRMRLRCTLEVLLMDLFWTALRNPEQWLAYSRRKEDYRPGNRRYMGPQVTHQAMLDVVSFLERRGYAETRRGSYKRVLYEGIGQVEHGGYRSRIRATSALLYRLRAESGLGFEDIGFREGMELVRLKGEPRSGSRAKPLIPYVDTPETRRMRQALEDWAGMMARHQVLLPSLSEGAHKSREEEEDGPGELVEPRSLTLYRVFNDGRWDRGGRFYGGPWIRLSKELRALIRIDGEPVVELDFKSLHPRLCYHLEGSPLAPDEDPYDLGPRFAGVRREDVKVAFNKLIAVRRGGKVREADGEDGPVLPDGITYRKLLQAIQRKHQAIRPWLRRGRATELQNIDSRIAEKVLAYFTFRGRPVLPVHDSFIVAESDEARLGETMILAYRGVLKGISGVEGLPVVSGWSSPELEREAVMRVARALSPPLNTRPFTGSRKLPPM